MTSALPCWFCIFQALTLLIAANGTPVIVDKLFGQRYNKPIDFGVYLNDGQRLFGKSKTWRGLCSAIFMATVLALMFGLTALTGVLFGILAMAGDLVASFGKRRRGQVESSRARGWDTLPESLLPLGLLSGPLALDTPDILLVTGLFFLCEEFVSPILYRLHIRNRPY